jgi:hypothetical protein
MGDHAWLDTELLIGRTHVGLGEEGMQFHSVHGRKNIDPRNQVFRCFGLELQMPMARR